MKSRIVQIIFWVLLCQLVGVAGSFFTSQGLEPWYANLQKPVFNPPNWLFGPVWTVLYALMGISAYLVYREVGKKPGVSRAIRLFMVHLIFNFTFSFSFFYLESTLLGLVNILIVWIFIVIIMVRFRRVNATASWLLVPYLLWVSYATVVNAALWWLNR